MAISLMTNAASLGAQHYLAKTQDALTQNVGRLSSGLRINRAADDAAGLAISSKLTAQIRGLTQAARNSNDAVSMIQVAEGSLGEVNGMLARMRELGVQASNEGTLGTSERAALDLEYQALADEIDRISASTEYNGAKLLDGSLSAGVNFQVGNFDTANDRISVTAFSGSSTTNLALNTTSLTTAANARTALGALDTAIGSVAANRGQLGAAQNRVAVTISNLGSVLENLSAANSRILDVDVAEETAKMTRNQILMQAGVAVLAQANQLPSVALSLIGK